MSIIERLKRSTEPAVKTASTLSEVFAVTAMDPAVTGFVLAHLRHKTRPILCVQDHVSAQEAGRLYVPGLRHLRSLVQVDVTRPADALFAMEEGLRCGELSAVIGEIWGDPQALNFTATKRLMMRAEASGVPCWLIRRNAQASLSAARDRWRVSSLPSERHPYDARAPGAARWQAELFRSRHLKPGTWTVSYDRSADRLNFSTPFRDGTVGADTGTLGQPALS